MSGNGTAPCALSECDTSNSSTFCETRIELSSDWAQLCMIVFLPLAIMLFAPGIARGGTPCAQDDDSRSFFAGDALPIDPPMFLCGIGLLPLDCGLSGLLAVVMVMAFAFVVIFFAFLTSDYPCTTGLGRCRTISCICGNGM